MRFALIHENVIERFFLEGDTEALELLTILAKPPEKVQHLSRELVALLVHDFLNGLHGLGSHFVGEYQLVARVVLVDNFLQAFIESLRLELVRFAVLTNGLLERLDK